MAPKGYEAIEHLQASSLKVAQLQVGCELVPSQGHRQRRGLLLQAPLLHTEGDPPQLNCSATNEEIGL